jgi:hypothetical protein
MKPLELTVYPKLKWPRRGAEIEPYRKQWRQERKVIESKRFTDAELAAEYYRQAGLRFETKSSGWLVTLHRFATLPHYDEVSL